MERGISPETNGGANLGSNSKRWGKVYTQEIDEAANLGNNYSIGFRRPSQDYALGDIAFIQLSATKRKKLVCVQAGTTASGDLTLASTAEGSITTDGTVVWAVDSLADGNYSAGHQNGIYREADLTAYFDSGLMSANIATSKFVNIYPGDYIVKSITIDGTTYNNIKWICGDIDYFYNRGDSQKILTHHVLMVPAELLGVITMNQTDTSSGGYFGSDFYQNILPKYDEGIVNAFGDDHVLSAQHRVSNGVSYDYYSSTAPFYKGTAVSYLANVPASKSNLMNSAMVVGTLCGSSYVDIADANTQISVFALRKELITLPRYYLQDVQGSGFVYVYRDGHCAYSPANSTPNGPVSARPYFLLY